MVRRTFKRASRRAARAAERIAAPWRSQGGLYTVLDALNRIAPAAPLYRRLANGIARSTVPETLVAASGIIVDQAWPERRIAMQAFAEKHLNGPFVALEIGTWFGDGSTAIWASRLGDGARLIVVDSWREYVSRADKATSSAYAGMDDVHRVAIHSALERIFRYEKERPGEILLMRGRATAIGALFQPASFDFVYVDGSHYYADVVEDIRMAKRLVKDGGILCGDDLELAPSEALLALARANLDRDFIAGDTAGSWFHPGVLLAVAEELGAVGNSAGFWSVVRRGDRWLPT